VVVGLNTGCSEAFPYKRLPVEYQARLVDELCRRYPEIRVVLLGGPEDRERNPEIAGLASSPVIETPCDEGLRRGILYTDLAEVVITGDTLGMHLAIGLQKRVVAWFGLSCAQEIDFYDRGQPVLAGVTCRPCWRRACDQSEKCFESVDMEEMLEATGHQIEAARKEKQYRR
jgi:heptosyltransferase-2